jgi:phosphatidylserine/phosphatidylglycerophosphate/cardiolipin synthase-like enzyme
MTDRDGTPGDLSRREALGLAAAALAGLAGAPAEGAATPPGAEGWFDTTRGMWPVRAGNEVVELIDGPETFAAMVAAIRTATGRGPNGASHFIYLLGWTLFPDFRLIPSEPGTSIRSLFTAASARGVEIRSMLWLQPAIFTDTNQIAVDLINGRAVPTGGAILDSRNVFYIPKFTAHHQKVLVVNGEQGLIAFCGGIDINPDRMYPVPSSPGSPDHDVHCRVRGPAAADLVQVFIERWRDHPDVKKLPTSRQGLRALRLPAPGPVRGANAAVQVARTYANGFLPGQFPPEVFDDLQAVYDALREKWPVLPPGPIDPPDLREGYSFAPFGEQQVARMLVRAIGRARRYIYVEDQYFVDTGPNDAGLDVRGALMAALPRLDNLTVVLTHPDLLQLPQKRYRRRIFIEALKRAGGSKVRIFHLTPPGDPHTYVHSKLWVMDDQFAVVGSANFNRRSWANDSEAVVGFYDPPTANGGGVPRRLRMRLWAEHLNVPMRAVADPIAAARLWLRPGPGAKVAPYLTSATADEVERSDLEWFLVDPDGSGNGLGPYSPF